MRFNDTISAFVQSRLAAQDDHEAAVVDGATVVEVVVVVAAIEVDVVGATVVEVVLEVDVVVVADDTVVSRGGVTTVSEVVVDVRVTGEVDSVGCCETEEPFSRATSHVTVMFCWRHFPVRGRFNTRVETSTHAVAFLPRVNLATFIDPLGHRAPSASFMIRVLESTQSCGGSSIDDHVTLNSPR